MFMPISNLVSRAIKLPNRLYQFFREGHEGSRRTQFKVIPNISRAPSTPLAAAGSAQDDRIEVLRGFG